MIMNVILGVGLGIFFLLGFIIFDVLVKVFKRFDRPQAIPSAVFARREGEDVKVYMERCAGILVKYGATPENIRTCYDTIWDTVGVEPDAEEQFRVNDLILKAERKYGKS